jgi:hypothetical protein
MARFPSVPRHPDRSEMAKYKTTGNVIETKPMASPTSQGRMLQGVAMPISK